MNFTGENLMLVYKAFDLAIAEIGYQIGNCPDVYEYADDLVALEAERERMLSLKTSVYKRLTPDQLQQLAA